MSGTYMRDAVVADLLVGATLNAAGTTNGGVNTVNWPQEVTFFLTTGTVTGTTPTLVVEIEGDETADFSGTTTRSLGTFDTIGAVSNGVFRLTCRVDAKHVRARVTITGTSPVYTGSTCTMEPPHHLRGRHTNTAGALT